MNNSLVLLRCGCVNDPLVMLGLPVAEISFLVSTLSYTHCLIKIIAIFPVSSCFLKADLLASFSLGQPTHFETGHRLPAILNLVGTFHGQISWPIFKVGADLLLNRLGCKSGTPHNNMAHVVLVLALAQLCWNSDIV